MVYFSIKSKVQRGRGGQLGLKGLQWAGPRPRWRPEEAPAAALGINRHPRYGQSGVSREMVEKEQWR